MGRAGRGRGDFGRVEAMLAEAGVRMPPMPADAESRLKEREEGCFSTRTFKVSPAELLHYVRKAIGGVSPDYALIAIARLADGGDGLHYYLVQGPLQLFLQLRWGTGPAERERAAAAVAECFALAHELVAVVPQSLRRGLLDRTGRITIVGTEVGEGFWEVARLEGRETRLWKPRSKGRVSHKPREILEEALVWCRTGVGLGNEWKE
jgi:hypothetical protein